MLTRRQLMKRGAIGGAGLVASRALLAGPALGAPSVATQPQAVRRSDAAARRQRDRRDRRRHGEPERGADLAQGPQGPSGDHAVRLPALRWPGHDRSASRRTSARRSWPGRGVPIAVNYHNDLAPDDYLRVFTNGGSSYLQFPPAPEVRILTHLHGAFVAGNDDGNPYAQPDAFSVREHAVGHLPERAAGGAVLVPRPLRGRHAHERRRGARRGLPASRRLRHRQQSAPPGADRPLRAADRRAGPPVQRRRLAALPRRGRRQRRPLDRRVLRRRACSSTARSGRTSSSSRPSTGSGCSTAATPGSSTSTSTACRCTSSARRGGYCRTTRRPPTSS